MQGSFEFYNQKIVEIATKLQKTSLYNLQEVTDCLHNISVSIFLILTLKKGGEARSAHLN